MAQTQNQGYHTETMEKAIKKYNDAVSTYNNSAQEDSDKDAFQKAEEEYKKSKN